MLFDGLVSLRSSENGATFAAASLCMRWHLSLSAVNAFFIMRQGLRGEIALLLVLGILQYRWTEAILSYGASVESVILLTDDLLGLPIVYSGLLTLHLSLIYHLKFVLFLLHLLLLLLLDVGGSANRLL